MTAVVSHAPVLGPLDSAPMRRKQVLILLLALLLAAMDGYDALAMAFAAPSVSQAWHVSKGALGLLLASGLFGMGLGAILVSPLADVWGRKRVALCALSLMTVGSLVCGFAGSVPMLAVGRIITGAGIGVMVAMTTLISAEFSSIKHRSLVIAGVATVGFPIGGVIGGVGAAFMIRTVGWEWIFLAGAIAGAALFVLVLLLLPESPAFLISRRAPDALDKLNHVLGRLGHPAIAALPAASERQRVSYKELLAPGLGVLTLRLLAINLLIAMAAYYMLNWLPQLIADAGFSAQTASLVSSLSGLVGIFGGVVLGALAARFPAPRLAGIAM
ncbi:MAG: MFS transporter, partial [bacterium]|nr:MFS transporter [bacterium]